MRTQINGHGSSKESIIIDGDFIIAIFKDVEEDDQERKLYLTFESINMRILIPFFVSNEEEAVEALMSAFYKIGELTVER